MLVAMMEEHSCEGLKSEGESECWAREEVVKGKQMWMYRTLSCSSGLTGEQDAFSF